MSEQPAPINFIVSALSSAPPETTELQRPVGFAWYSEFEKLKDKKPDAGGPQALVHPDRFPLKEYPLDMNAETKETIMTLEDELHKAVLVRDEALVHAVSGCDSKKVDLLKTGRYMQVNLAYNRKKHILEQDGKIETLTRENADLRGEVLSLGEANAGQARELEALRGTNAELVTVLETTSGNLRESEETCKKLGAEKRKLQDELTESHKKLADYAGLALQHAVSQSARHESSLRGEVVKLEADLMNNKKELEQRNQQLMQKDQQLMQKDQQLMQKDQLIAQKEQQAVQLAAAVNRSEMARRADKKLIEDFNKGKAAEFHALMQEHQDLQKRFKELQEENTTLKQQIGQGGAGGAAAVAVAVKQEPQDDA